MCLIETKIKYISADVTDETLIDKGVIFTQKRGEDEFEEDEILEHFHENRDQRMKINLKKAESLPQIFLIYLGK